MVTMPEIISEAVYSQPEEGRNYSDTPRLVTEAVYRDETGEEKLARFVDGNMLPDLPWSNHMIIPENHPVEAANVEQLSVADWGDIGSVTIALIVVPPAFATVDEAKSAMMRWIETFTVQITGAVPIDEKLSWDAKEAAARAFASGDAQAHHIAMIEGEALITGESPSALVAKIIANANQYRAIASAVAGLRRKTNAALDAITDPQQYALVLSAAQTQAAVLAQSMGIV